MSRYLRTWLVLIRCTRCHGLSPPASAPRPHVLELSAANRTGDPSGVKVTRRQARLPLASFSVFTSAWLRTVASSPQTAMAIGSCSLRHSLIAASANRARPSGADWAKRLVTAAENQTAHLGQAQPTLSSGSATTG